MRVFRRLTDAIRAMAGRNRAESEMDEELTSYLDASIDAKIASGLSRAEARRQALAEFGSSSAVKDWVGDVGWASRLESVWQDVRYALRLFRRSRGFAAVAVLAFALGIGVNTAVFSVVNALLLRPLPVLDPGRLALLSEPVDYATWTHIHRRATPFDAALAWSFHMPLNAAPAGEKQPMSVVFASGSFFDTLGVRAIRGRTFSTADDRPGADAVAVISHALWHRRFGGSTDVVGRTLLLEGIPVTIIGVAPPAFTGLDVGQPFDAMLPLTAEPIVRGSASSLDEPMSFLRVVMVLRPGQSLQDATTTLRHIQRELPGYVGGDAGDADAPFTALPAGTGVSELREPYGQPLLTLLALVAIILVMASTNVACLMLARGSARRQELSVRLAIGAGRGRVVRQLIVEGALLSAAGAAVGLALAAWGSDALAAQISSDFGGMALEPVLDRRVLGFAALAAAVATIVSAALPAWRATSLDGSMSSALAPGDAGRTPSAARLSSAFVVAQIAMSLVLVVAAGLLIRTFGRLSTVPLGFDPERVLIVNIDNPHAQPTLPHSTRLAELAAAAASVPGVSGAGGAFVTPLGGAAMFGHIAQPGDSPSNDGRRVYLNFVTPGWLAASGTRLISGRDIAPTDARNTQPVALINESFAGLHFPGQDALGRVVRLNKTEERTVIGVTADAVYGSPREGVVPVMLMPASQSGGEPPPWGISLTIRTAGPPPANLVASVSAALSSYDRALTFSFQPLAEHVNASFARERLIAAVSALFGGLAVLLAAIGLYGVTEYTVAQRDLEITIRTALGARPIDVMRLVMGRTLVATTAGIGLGLIAAAGLSRFLQSLLFGVGPFDLATFATVPLVLVVIATAAAFVPARRALTSNLQALRRG